LILKYAYSNVFAVFAILKLPLIAEVESSIVFKKLNTFCVLISLNEIYKYDDVLYGFALKFNTPEG